MKDTKPEMLGLQRKILEKKSYGEKFLMSIDMYETSKSFVKGAILNEMPDISEDELRRELFRRFYKNDFTKVELEKITGLL